MELELCYFKRGRGIYNMKTNQLKERIVNILEVPSTMRYRIKGVIDFIICVFWYWWIKQLIMFIIAFVEFSGSHMQHRECNNHFLIYHTCALVTDPVISIVGIKLRHLCAIICWDRGRGWRRGTHDWDLEISTQKGNFCRL